MGFADKEINKFKKKKLTPKNGDKFA